MEIVFCVEVEILFQENHDEATNANLTLFLSFLQEKASQKSAVVGVVPGCALKERRRSILKTVGAHIAA